MTRNRAPKLKVAPQSVKRLKEKLRPTLSAGRGRALTQVIGWLNPVLRGWRQYFRLADVKSAFSELDEWIRRKLRGLVWRQWKTARTRFRQLMRRGVDRTAAALAAFSGRGPWYNAKCRPMIQAVPTSELRKLGLAFLVEQQLALA